VVDDCLMSRQLLRAILESAGLDVLEASSGVQCLDHVRSGSAALVLLDVMMPDEDGFHLLREIRREYAADVLPVIMVTSCAEEKDIVRGLTSGANDYLTKPFDKTTFLARIYNHITLSQMRKHVDERHNQVASLLDVQKALGDMIPEGIMVHNREGGILYRNEMLQKMCGGTEQVLAYEVLRRFLPLDLIGTMEREFVKHPSGLIEKEFCLLNSDIKHLLVRSAVVDMGRGEIARIWSFRDVSKLRALESDTRSQLERASSGKFVGELSNYMQALLTRISDVTAQLAMAQNHNALAAQYLDSIGRYVEQGRIFADKVVSLSSPQLLKSSVASEDLNEVLRVVVEAAQLSVGERIEFSLDADADLPKVPLTMQASQVSLGTSSAMRLTPLMEKDGYGSLRTPIPNTVPFEFKLMIPGTAWRPMWPNECANHSSLRRGRPVQVDRAPPSRDWGCGTCTRWYGPWVGTSPCRALSVKVPA